MSKADSGSRKEQDTEASTHATHQRPGAGQAGHTQGEGQPDSAKRSASSGFPGPWGNVFVKQADRSRQEGGQHVARVCPLLVWTQQQAQDAFVVQGGLLAVSTDIASSRLIRTAGTCALGALDVLWQSLPVGVRSSFQKTALLVVWLLLLLKTTLE